MKSGMDTPFNPNVNLLKAFNSQVMLINDREDCENGLTLIKAGADGPPIHLHPAQAEHFNVLQGRLQVYKEGKWHELGPGEEMFIPAQMPHSYRSRDAQDCLFAYRLTPGGRFSEMLKSFERLQDAGKITGKGLGSVIHLAMTFRQHRTEVVSVQPPNFVIVLVAGLGKLLGFKA